MDVGVSPGAGDGVQWALRGGRSWVFWSWGVYVRSLGFTLALGNLQAITVLKVWCFCLSGLVSVASTESHVCTWAWGGGVLGSRSLLALGKP